MTAAWRNYDDEALAALASAGLLRRAAKDVEAGKVGWAEDDPAGGTIVADGGRVQVAAGGPGAARCDCPAPGICKHILAAALWLRTAPPPATPAAALPAAALPAAVLPAAAPVADDAPAPAAAPPATDVLAEVLALDQAAVFKTAGIAAARKAAGLLHDLEDAAIAVQGSVLAITLPGLDLVCRYVAGAGFTGMVSVAEPRLHKALHLLALAAVWRAHGRQIAWPDAVAAAVAAAPGAAMDADERAFLAQARALVHELCAGGWSHVGDLAAPQLRALATSARVESFPRLAGLLRGLAGTADLLARRDFGADERQALRLAAETGALATALERAGPADAALVARLRGSARRSFDTGATLELLPLGAHWWERRSGARGLTVAFWDPAALQVRAAVLARRDGSDPGFSKAGAWQHGALWPGTGAPAALAGSSLVLDQPRLAEDGRLGIGAGSGGGAAGIDGNSAGGTRAGTLPGWPLHDPRWQAAGFDDWRALRAALAGGAGLLGERLELALLRPAACDPPRLDEVRQEIRWHVHDRHGQALLLRLPYEAWKSTRLDNLEAWTASGVAIAGIVARLERLEDQAGDGGLLEPVTLLLERDGKPHAVSLDFDAGPVRPGFGARIARMLARRTAAPAARRPPAHERVLDALLARLERRAMSGHFHLPDGGDDFGTLHDQLLALGLDTPARMLARYRAAPSTGGALALVQVIYTCLELDTSFLDA
jgi:hypothetical protein